MSGSSLTQAYYSVGRSGDQRPPLLRAVGMLIRLNTLEQRKVAAGLSRGRLGPLDEAIVIEV